jgi:hypothetical protein
MQEQQGLCKSYELKVQLLRESYPSFEDFAIAINPDTQVDCAADERGSIMNDYSTLALLDKAYGSGAASSWLVPAIANLNTFTGSKNMNDDQTKKLATLIAQEYKEMKYSVMQLFFYRFKCGHFGKFYGKVDPMVITCALKDFADECEQKRQEYLNEEYEARKKEEDDFRQDVYRKWYEFSNEFKEHIVEVDKKVLDDIYIEKIYFTDKCILLSVTKDQYDLLEGIYSNPYFLVFKKYFPDITIQYRLRKVLSPAELLQSENSKKTLLTANEEKIAISSARAVIDNTYKLDKSGLALLRDAFRKRYGCFPEDFLSKHKNNDK